LSTWHSGIPELVEDGVSGYLVPERDVGALGDRLISLCDHPEQWAEMGQHGRKKVEDEFDMTKINKRLEGLYDVANEG
jgi:colanic acid/amylovoran biosynthesis glycosyltransferase